MNKSAKSSRSAKSNKSAKSKKQPARAATKKAAVKASTKAAAPPKQVKKQAAKQEGNGLGPKKLYLKSRPACKVTFRLPQQAAPEARQVSLVGDFNGWSSDATPMKRLKAGDFTATMELEQGREYRFRYLIEGGRWENDWGADRYEPNSFGGDDSVISC